MRHSRSASRRSAPWLLAAALAFHALGGPLPARADVTALAPAGDAAAEEPAPPEATVPANLKSPRAVLMAFIELMREDKKREAAELLDLSKLSSVAAESRGSDLAYKLYQLVPAVGDPPTEGDSEEDLGRLLRWQGSSNTTLDYTKAPDNPDYDDTWPLTEWLRYPTDEASQLTIARNEQKEWRFSADTVSRIDALYETLEPRIDQLAEQRAANGATNGEEAVGEPTETIGVWLRRQFPQSLRTTYFLLPTYQWLLLLALLPIGRLTELVVRWVLTWLGDLVLFRLDPAFIEDHETTEGVWRPVGQMANAAVWAYGAHLIELPSHVTNILLTVLVIVAVVATVLAIFRVLDLVAGYFMRRAKRDKRRFDDLFVPLATSTAKIAVALGGVIATFAVFNDELPSTLIGGLGIGGIAIALASQETLSNFIGSITLLFDRPFEVGDWVQIDTVEGEVESLGFRSTRLRTGINSQVTLPNNKLASSSVDNWGRRKYRRYLNKLGLEYGTPPDRIEAFCEGVRELIRRHPHTRKDFYAAYFNDFGPSSLDVLVVCFFEVPDWATELRERHRLLADIARLAESVGVAFAFPTQTLHLHRDEGAAEAPDLGDAGPDSAGARAAAQIAGELPNYQDRPGKVKFPGPTSFE